MERPVKRPAGTISVQRAAPRPKTVSPEFIEKLRNLGARPHTIKFASRFLPKSR
jgi:hypothetical protein